MFTLYISAPPCGLPPWTCACHASPEAQLNTQSSTFIAILAHSELWGVNLHGLQVRNVVELGAHLRTAQPREVRDEVYLIVCAHQTLI